ncbi:MAG: type III-B CRISPR module RAMP protein Cmr4, partial [Mariprofundaceae bacterium]
MFEAHKAMFIYCTTPVHAGAGQAFGLVDNPIQREKHTGHPVIAGSGVKGALRHHLWWKWKDGDGDQTRDLLIRIFGPEAGNSDLHAGAVSFSDAQLVAFPVRSVRRGFVYATSPHCLARAQRMLSVCGLAKDWRWPDMQEGQAVILNAGLKSGDKLLLEAQSIEVIGEGDDGLQKMANDLARFAIPEGGHFHDKLKQDLVLLSDTDFGWFVKQSTVVEAHVRIDDDTGTADHGGLFYTENLPPESILLSLAMASRERVKGDDARRAEVMLQHVVGALDGEAVQIGGDATTGRGLVRLNFVGG